MNFHEDKRQLRPRFFPVYLFSFFFFKNFFIMAAFEMKHPCIVASQEALVLVGEGTVGKIACWSHLARQDYIYPNIPLNSTDTRPFGRKLFIPSTDLLVPMIVLCFLCWFSLSVTKRTTVERL